MVIGRWRSARRVARVQAGGGLTIRITSGSGTGLTRLAAFDAALKSAGVADFNLIRLYSVIPPGSKVRQVSALQQLRGSHGDRLYCVSAEAYASTPAVVAWAGIGWSRRDDDSDVGLFVEHHGMTQEGVESDVRLSLAGMSEVRGGGFTAVGIQLASARCIGHPVCALVIATYQTVPWDD
jgi:arginine decarboxylase